VIFFFYDDQLLILIICRPEPHILLFRRPLGTDPATGKVNALLEKEAKEKYAQEMGI
jgi:cyclin-dependent kinase regulatory subunit CKS1